MNRACSEAGAIEMSRVALAPQVFPRSGQQNIYFLNPSSARSTVLKHAWLAKSEQAWVAPVCTNPSGDTSRQCTTELPATETRSPLKMH